MRLITWFLCFLLDIKSVFPKLEMPTQGSDLTEESEDDFISDEKRLVQFLLARYRRLGQDGRPVKNSSQPVSVLFGLGLIKMELYEKENMLELSTWARYKWMDEYLRWDPDQYGGVNSVKLSDENIWTPDIMLYNTANTNENERKARAVITYEGVVTWYPHKVFSSSCAIDVRSFPFDNQTCYMWFGSWTHTVDEVDVTLAFPGGLDLGTFKSVYKDACEWDIYNNSAERIVLPPEGDQKYAILSFTIHLKRKMNFSTYILTMPAIFLGFLTLLEFWLPPEHADKSALGLTIFGSLLLLLLILVEAAPPTASAVPLLGIYYCFTTVIVILSIFLSSLVVKLGRPGEINRKSLPKIPRILIINGLGRLLCMKPIASSSDRKKPKEVKENGIVDETTGEKEPLSREDRERQDALMSYEDFKVNGTTSSLGSIERRLMAVYDLLLAMVNNRTEREVGEKMQREIDLEWRHLALILDRLFFVCYLVVIIGSLLLLFPRSNV